jgi:hypothetical protein
MTEKPKPPFREAPPPAAEPVAAEPPKPDYAEMLSAPLDGTHVLLSDGVTEVRALWAETRKMQGGRWTPTGHWLGTLDRAKIAFEPVGWRLAPEPWQELREDTERARREDLARRA